MSPKKVGFIEAIKLFFKNYVNFSGRSTRSEFWFAYLFVMIGSIVTGFIDGIITGISIASAVTSDYNSTPSFTLSIFGTLFNLAVLLPLLSAEFRRLHDTGKSGTYIFIDTYSRSVPFDLLFMRRKLLWHQRMGTQCR